VVKKRLERGAETLDTYFKNESDALSSVNRYGAKIGEQITDVDFKWAAVKKLTGLVVGTLTQWQRAEGNAGQD
jgi:hypothetical protein